MQFKKRNLHIKKYIKRGIFQQEQERMEPWATQNFKGKTKFYTSECTFQCGREICLKDIHEDL